jgi:hypothetical protein
MTNAKPNSVRVLLWEWGLPMRLVVMMPIAMHVVVLSSCSPPSFEKPTANLSKGFSETRTAFETLAEDERKSFIAKQVREGLQSGNLILPRNCAQIMSTLPPGTPSETIDCRPSIYVRANNSTNRIEFDSGASDLLKYGKVLDAYGKALAELGAAKDVAALKDATSSAIEGVGGIAAAFGGPAGAAAAAGLKVVAVGVGFYLDQRRLQELRHIVKAADVSVGAGLDEIVRAAIEMQRSAVLDRNHDLTVAGQSIDAMRAAGADQRRIQAAGEALAADHYALQAYARIDLRESLGKMREAHAKLLEALEHPQYEPEVALKAINTFLTKITAVKDELVKLGSNK